MAYRSDKYRVAMRSALHNVGGFIDDVLEPFAPTLCENRRKARHRAAVMEKRREVQMRTFEAAEMDRQRGDQWLRSQLSTDSALDVELETMRTNSNELFRNFGYAGAAVMNRTNNVIGTGIQPDAEILSKASAGVDAERAELLSQQLIMLWESVQLTIGHVNGGRVPLWMLQRLAHISWLRDGEILVIFSDVPRPDALIPLQVDLVDAARLETPLGGAMVTYPDGSKIPFQDDFKSVRLGVHKPADEILGYFVRDSHPGESRNPKFTYHYFPVDRCAHIFERLWVDQNRGLPWLFSIINTVKDFQSFREAVITGAHVGACMSAIVTGSNPEQMKKNSLDANGNLQLRPGGILFLDDLSTVEAFNPAQTSTTLEAFDAELLHEMAAALTEPFGWMTGDRRGATYSAGKLDEIEGRVMVEISQKMHVDLWLRSLWHRYVRQAVLYCGQIEISIEEFLANPTLFLRHSWGGPGRPLLDPGKEAAAAIQLVRENLMTKKQWHSRFGTHSRDIFRQRGRENQLEERYHCVPKNQNNESPPPTPPDQLPNDDDQFPFPVGSETDSAV